MLAFQLILARIVARVFLKKNLQIKGPLIMYAFGWARIEIGGVNDFCTALKLGIYFFIVQMFGCIFLIALYWLGSYYFYSEQGSNMNISLQFQPEARIINGP